MPAGVEITAPEPFPAVVTESECWIRAKLAVTLRGASILRMHVGLVSEQSPDQPTNVDMESGTAVRMTSSAWNWSAAHSDPQSMRPSPLPPETRPAPVPAMATESTCLVRSKLAVTLWAASIVTVHEGLVPVHAPDQPANVDASSGTAVRLISVPWLISTVHTGPQLMRWPRTSPNPAPVFVTASGYFFSSKTAATLWSASTLTVHEGLVPVHAPDQPAKVEFASATAVNETELPAS
jgi:uncharacterized protein YjeT (DUF2065 family)